MYTLVMLIIAYGTPGTPPQLAMTSFPIEQKVCGNAARTLAAQSTKIIQIHTYCVPGVNR